MKNKTLYSNCSEVTHRIKIGSVSNKDVEKFIIEIMKEFEPYDSDPLSCHQFVFFDEMSKGHLIFRARDDSHEEEFIELEKKAKRLNLQCEQIDDCKPLFSEGNNFYYKQNGIVKVTDLGYSNNKTADKINHELLKMWDRKNIEKSNEEHRESFKEEFGY